MRIVYHLGVHCTDEERLVRTLLQNKDALAADGIEVPDPARYRNLIRETAIALKGGVASVDQQALVLEQIMDADRADRLILSWDNFLGFPPWAVFRALYPQAGQRLRAITRIFPEIEAEFHLALRNPATFLPTILSRQTRHSYEQVMSGAHPQDLLWSRMIADIRAHLPDAPITVWCDEDTPLLWPEVLRNVSGHSENLQLDGDDDLLQMIMSPEGFRRMQGYMATHPPRNTGQWRRIVSAFLDKFALPDQIEMQFEMPGWTDELVQAMTAQYDHDLARIARIPGVTVLRP